MNLFDFHNVCVLYGIGGGSAVLFASIFCRNVGKIALIHKKVLILAVGGRQLAEAVLVAEIAA